MVLRENREIVPESLENLPDEEENEKIRLLESGLTFWTKSDFFAFIRGSELFGRENYEQITEKVKTKTIEEVKEYAERFWKLVDTLED